MAGESDSPDSDTRGANGPDRTSSGVPLTAATDPGRSSTAAVRRSQRTLLKGGTIISMDPSVGDLAAGDVLIEGSRIADVSARIEDSNATIVDARDRIVIPGFCDPHIHCWQGQLARLIPNHVSEHPSPTRNYRRVMHEIFGPCYRPEDIYIGTLATLLAALDGGITTVCDNSHNSRSPEHADAAVQALRDAGVRGVFAYGRPRTGHWDRFSDAYRIRAEHFSSEDQLTTFRLFMRGRDPREELDALLHVRRELDVWVTFDSGLGVHPISELYSDGSLDGRETYNHGTDIDVVARRVMTDHGVAVNVCPRIETQFRIGNVPYQEWVDVGARPGISNDDPATYSIDMFHEMHVLYAHQRAEAHRALDRHEDGGPTLVTVRDMLEAATIRGAENCGLAHKVGSLSPGKEADIVMIRTDSLRLHPIHSAIATVVQGADIGSVDTVFVAGKVVKWQGRLVAVNPSGLRAAVDASRDHLFLAAQWPLEKIDFSD